VRVHAPIFWIGFNSTAPRCSLFTFLSSRGSRAASSRAGARRGRSGTSSWLATLTRVGLPLITWRWAADVLTQCGIDSQPRSAGCDRLLRDRSGLQSGAWGQHGPSPLGRPRKVKHEIDVWKSFCDRDATSLLLGISRTDVHAHECIQAYVGSDRATERQRDELVRHDSAQGPGERLLARFASRRS